MNLNISNKEVDEELVKVFRALSDSSRLEIIRLLAHDQEEYNCTWLGEHIDMSQPTMSYHMKILREAGLINARKVSREKFVSLNQDTFDRLIPGVLDVL